jgi:hypothetical protein
MYNSRLSNFRVQSSVLWRQSSSLPSSTRYRSLAASAPISRCRIRRQVSFHASSSLAAKAFTAASYSAASIVDQPKLFYTPDQKKVMDACKDLHGSIMPLNEKVRILLAFAAERLPRDDGASYAFLFECPPC